jgi:hypothetical protein
MLYNEVNHFNWQVNNYSDTYPGNAAATTLTADAVAHTKGTDTALLAGIAYDCYGIAITVTLGFTDATIRRQMIDLRIDPAAGVGNAGSSWSAFIDNLYTNSPTNTANMPGHQFYFPVFLPAGTAIGARVQDVVGGATCRFSIQVVGQPTRPDLLKVGHKVQTLGATTASTSGVAITPGTGAVGSYTASLGTLTSSAWWWQFGIGSNDTTITGNTMWFDVAHDATSKYICLEKAYYGGATGDHTGKVAFGITPPVRNAPAGTDVYVRGSALGTPDGTMTTVVYAVT